MICSTHKLLGVFFSLIFSLSAKAAPPTDTVVFVCNDGPKSGYDDAALIVVEKKVTYGNNVHTYYESILQDQGVIDFFVGKGPVNWTLPTYVEVQGIPGNRKLVLTPMTKGDEILDFSTPGPPGSVLMPENLNARPAPSEARRMVYEIRGVQYHSEGNHSYYSLGRWVFENCRQR